MEDDSCLFWKGKNTEHKEQGWDACEQGVEGRRVSSLHRHPDTLRAGLGDCSMLPHHLGRKDRLAPVCLNAPIPKLNSRAGGVGAPQSLGEQKGAQQQGFTTREQAGSCAS